MRYPLAAATAFASITQAFLLPPNVSTNDKKIAESLSFDAAVEADGRVTTLACPGCPVAVHGLNGRLRPLQVNSVLQMNFSVEHKDSDVVLLNGHPLYPLDPTDASFMQPLLAPQLIQTGPSKWSVASTSKLGYSLRIERPVSSKADQLEMVSLVLDVVEVGGVFVSGIPTVELKIVKTASGKLMIGDLTTKESSGLDAGKECTNFVCKWRAIMASRLANMKGSIKSGCGKAKGHLSPAVSPMLQHGSHREHGGFRGHPRPRPHGPHRHHRHHKHHIGRFFRGMVLHVAVPVMIGAVAGILASLVGMMVGSFVIFVWRALFRRNAQPAYARVEQDEESIEAKQSAIPTSAPPAYEDAVVEEKESE